MQKSVANSEEIGFGNSQIPIENLNELALDPSNITFAKRVRDHRPVDVLQSRVVGVLGGNDEATEEDAVEGPLLCLNGEIRLGAFDVREGNKKVGGSNLSSLDNVRHELGELRVLAGAGNCASARRGGGWDTKGQVNDLGSGLNNMF